MKFDLVVDEALPTWRPGAEWESRARSLVEAVGPSDGGLEVVLTGDDAIRVLNRDYRGKDRPTDVLSFSYLSGHRSHREELLAGDVRAKDFSEEPQVAEEHVLVGQILISVDTVRSRKVRKHHSDEDELLFLVTHGLLHTLGYDHGDEAQAEEMERMEADLLRRFDETRASRPHRTEDGDGS